MPPKTDNARKYGLKHWTISQIVSVFILTGVFITSLLLIVAFFTYFHGLEHIYPGIHVENTPLTGLSPFDAAVRLNRDWNVDRQIAVGYVKDGLIKTWYVSPASLGLEVNVIDTVSRAYAIGHTNNLPMDIKKFATNLQTSQAIEPAINFDPEAAILGLKDLAVKVQVQPRNAGLSYNGDGFDILPSEPGFSLDVMRTVGLIEQDPQKIILEGYLPLILQTNEPGIKDVNPAISEIERLTGNPGVISGYDPVTNQFQEWSIPQAQLRSWITLDEYQNTIRVGFNQEEVNRYLTGLSSSLRPTQELDVTGILPQMMAALTQGMPLSVIIKHPPTTYIVQVGDTYLKIGWKVGIPYWRVMEANPDIPPEALKPDQALVIPTKDDLLPLPVIMNKRIIISISEQRLWTYENGTLRSEHVISTGIDRSPTQPGVFQVQTHELSAYASLWDLTMPHFLGIYEAWPGFMNGIHGLPTLSNGQRLWANILGKPASFGCIILDLGAAENLYNWADNGIVVEIQP